MLNTIQLPQDLYEAVRQKALAQQKTTEDLVIEWVSAHLDEAEHDDMTQAFEQEVAAFERLKTTLLAQYAARLSSGRCSPAREAMLMMTPPPRS